MKLSKRMIAVIGSVVLVVLVVVLGLVGNFIIAADELPSSPADEGESPSKEPIDEETTEAPVDDSTEAPVGSEDPVEEPLVGFCGSLEDDELIREEIAIIAAANNEGRDESKFDIIIDNNSFGNCLPSNALEKCYMPDASLNGFLAVYVEGVEKISPDAFRGSSFLAHVKSIVLAHSNLAQISSTLFDSLESVFRVGFWGLDQADMSGITDAIDQLPNVYYVNLSQNKNLVKIPSGLKVMTKPLILYLNDNENLTDFDNKLFKDTVVKEIYLQHTPIATKYENKVESLRSKLGLSATTVITLTLEDEP